MKETELKKYLNPSLYRILCVKNFETDLDLIKKNYKGLVKEFHPDKKAEEDKTAANEKTQEIVNAYQIISSDDLRPRYDQVLKPYLELEKKKSEAKTRVSEEEITKKYKRSVKVPPSAKKPTVDPSKIKGYTTPEIEALKDITDLLKEFIKYASKNKK